MPRERKQQRKIVANPDDPRAGQYEFQLYKLSHPVTGSPETIAALKKQLVGLRGHRVTMIVTGSHTSAGDPENPKRFRLQRVVNFRKYADVFGPGSAYHSVIKYVRDNYSDETLVTNTITFAVADEDDDDDEEGMS